MAFNLRNKSQRHLLFSAVKNQINIVSFNKSAPIPHTPQSVPAHSQSQNS